MFDPTSVIHNSAYIYVCRHEGHDYHGPTPWKVRLNPLRLEIGIRTNPKRAPRWTFNRNGRLAVRWSNFTWRLWRKRAWERRHEH